MNKTIEWLRQDITNYMATDRAMKNPKTNFCNSMNQTKNSCPPTPNPSKKNYPKFQKVPKKEK